MNTMENFKNTSNPSNNDSNAITQKKNIRKNPYILPAIMWSLCVLFYSYQYLLQVSPSVMTQDLMRNFNVHATALGSLAACYFYTYALMQIPAGLVFDRFLARRPLTIAMLLCTIGCFLFAATHYFAVTVLGRLLIGLGGAFSAIGTMYIAANWLPLKLFALLIGIDVAVGMLGAICGQAPLAFLVNTLGWQNTTFLFTLIGLLLSACFWLIMRDLPKTNALTVTTTPLTATSKKAPKIPFKSAFINIIHNRQIWLVAIYGGCTFMPISVFGSLWGTPFFMHKYGISNTAAGSITTMLFVGLAVGTPFFGWLSDHIKQRKSIMLYSTIGSLISMLGFIYLTIPIYLSSILLFAYSFFAGGSLVCFAAARESDTSNSPGTTLGFVNMLNMLGGAIMQPIVGWLLDLQWNGAIENGVRVYSLTGFKIALLAMPLCVTAAILVLPFTKETHPHTFSQCVNKTIKP